MLAESLEHLQPRLPLLGALVAVGAAGLLTAHWLGRRRVRQRLQEARDRRETALQHLQTAALHLGQQNPAVSAGSILSLSLQDLAQKLREASLSPEDVLRTYMEKALQVTRELNCVTDYLQECEAQLRRLRGQDRRGLLYGVPVSLKDNFNCKGHDSTLGLQQNLFCPVPEDCVVVQVLKAQGAIPFVKTNIPQSLLSYDCSNVIFGQTLNPWNHEKTSGGSSGGEAALIAGGGSVLGLGTDIGGSIRFPGAFCGICSLKPTGNRLSRQGVKSSLMGQKTVTAAVGPMARDVDSLALCMKALLCDHMFRLDPTVPPIPFRDEVYDSTSPLRIGYYETDGFMMPVPSMRRAILETKQLLEAAGHTLVPFTLPRLDYAVLELAMRGLAADGGSTFLKAFKGDFVDPTLKSQILLFKLPGWLKRLLSIVLRPLYPRIAKSLKNLAGVSSVQDLWLQHVEATEYCHEFITEWNKLELDVMLCPLLSPAQKIGYPGKLFAGICYTVLYNLLNFPAGVVPVTTVTEKDERELKHHQGYYKDPWDKQIVKAMEGGVGLPVAVQCVALPWQEELCLRFMKEVERLTQQKRKKDF
ncbi:vitamin D3 hydroxylase-associated protein [Microcaecilia unicolor]|uniref:Fatty-acid amide hydrolase 1 n=1 Tax=Microcaecilia unicolor TaxID=1415580 RepID=A0A6P7YD92_9AMPH|nr:fatty-acid amide hydrolase 1 [Microcaecilia unicolor]